MNQCPSIASKTLFYNIAIQLFHQAALGKLMRWRDGPVFMSWTSLCCSSSVVLVSTEMPVSFSKALIGEFCMRLSGTFCPEFSTIVVGFTGSSRGGAGMTPNSSSSENSRTPRRLGRINSGISKRSSSTKYCGVAAIFMYGRMVLIMMCDMGCDRCLDYYSRGDKERGCMMLLDDTWICWLKLVVNKRTCKQDPLFASFLNIFRSWYRDYQSAARYMVLTPGTWYLVLQRDKSPSRDKCKVLLHTYEIACRTTAKMILAGYRIPKCAE